MFCHLNHAHRWRGELRHSFQEKRIPANVMLTLCIGLVWVLFSIIFENNADLKLVTRETAVSLCDIWYYNPKPRIPDFTSENFLDSGIWITLHGTTAVLVPCSYWINSRGYIKCCCCFVHVLSTMGWRIPDWHMTLLRPYRNSGGRWKYRVASVTCFGIASFYCLAWRMFWGH